MSNKTQKDKNETDSPRNSQTVENKQSKSLKRKATDESDVNKSYKKQRLSSTDVSNSTLSVNPKSDVCCSTKGKKYEIEDQNLNPEDRNVLTEALSLDCEMVGTGYKGRTSELARVAIVNEYSTVVYHAYVKPKKKVTDFRTFVSGIRPSDIKNGRDFSEVQREISALIEGRIVVGHALKNDFNVLHLSHPKSLIRDTSQYKPFLDMFGGKTPSLKNLALQLLEMDIQSGEHNPAEDAQAAMMLYLRNKTEWNSEFENHP